MLPAGHKYNFNPLSAATVKIELKLNDTVISTGTGSFVERESKIFLLTCWHVLTCRKPTAPSQTNGNVPGSPDHISFRFVGRKDLKIYSYSAPLYHGGFTPFWIDSGSSNIDLAILPVNLDDGDVFCINKIYYSSGMNIQPSNTLPKLELPSTFLAVGEDVFILGFPDGVELGIFPLWKKGAVASEPVEQVGGNKRFYIDASTRSGMSGAPVLVDQSLAASKQGIIISGGPHYEFVGVYSSHIDSSRQLPEVGIVWSKDLISHLKSPVAFNPYPPEAV